MANRWRSSTAGIKLASTDEAWQAAPRTVRNFNLEKFSLLANKIRLEEPLCIPQKYCWSKHSAVHTDRQPSQFYCPRDSRKFFLSTKLTGKVQLISHKTGTKFESAIHKKLHASERQQMFLCLRPLKVTQLITDNVTELDFNVTQRTEIRETGFAS